MSHTFKVGEIATIVMAPNHDLLFPEYIGQEVEIVRGLSKVSVWEDRAHTCRRDEWCYVVRLRSGEEIAALPENLRKRRPPPDWVKLCNLNDIPRDIAKPDYVYEWSWNRE